jgi:hypothetical protein
MTTTAAPDLKPDHTGSEERPTQGRDLADTARQEPDTRSFAPTRGHKLGSDPYDDPTRARSALHGR